MLFFPTSYHFLTCNVLIRKWHPLFEDCLQCLVWWCQSTPLERAPLQRSWRWILSVRNLERRLVWKYLVQSTRANRFLSPQSRPCLAGSRPLSRQFSSARTPLKQKMSKFYIVTSLYCSFHLCKWGLLISFISLWHWMLTSLKWHGKIAFDWTEQETCEALWALLISRTKFI